MVWENAEKVIVISIVFLNCYFSVRSLIGNTKKLRNISFSIFSLSLALWIVSAYISEFYPISNPELSILFSKLAIFFGSCFVLSLYLFSESYLQNKLSKLSRLAIGIATILSLALFLTDNVVTGIVPIENTFSITYGNTYDYIFIPFNLLLILLIIYNFFIAYKKLKNSDKYHLNIFLIGTGITVISSIVFNLVVPIFTGFDIYYKFGNYSTIILTLTTYYSLTNEKFLNIDAIITELIAVLIVLAILIDTFFSVNSFTMGFKLMLLMLIAYGAYRLDLYIRKDIEQREKLETLTNKLKLANKELKELDEAKDNFLSMASHELNTPLSAIEGYLSMILDEGIGGKLNKTHRGYLEKVYNSSQRLAHLVKDLLNVSRIEQGRIHIVYNKGNINKAIKQALAEIKPEANKHKHRIIMNLDQNIPDTYFDIDRVTEIIINLTGNAIKYTPDGGKIILKSFEKEKMIHFSVIDNGEGIEKEFLKSIFKKFDRGGEAHDQGRGTGLGLFISKNLAELQDGKIKAESEGEGKGSTFTFSLPIIIKKPHDKYESEGPVLRFK